MIAAAFAGLHAQNLEESLTVEGKYTPEVIAADRLSVLPSVMSLAAPASSLGYELEGVAANFSPDALAMPATGWRSTKSFDASRGYVDLSLGSWLNSYLRAGYAAIRNEDTQLNVYLRHYSTSLWRAWKADPAKGIDEAASRRFRYDETVGADFSRRFAGAGTLSAALQYHYGHFNYYGTQYKLENTKGKRVAPSQNLNDVYGRVKWEKDFSEKLHLAADADFRYFGYRKYFEPAFIFLNGTGKSLKVENGSHETAVNVGASADYAFSKAHKLDLGVHYSGVINNPGFNMNLLRFLPGYDFNRDNVSLHLGAELAVPFRRYYDYTTPVFTLETSVKYRLRVAPDIRFTAKNNDLAFSATIGGGTYLRTMAWIYDMDYYSDPSYTCCDATYSPIDARLALQYNPGGRFTFGVEGIWTTLIDQPFGGIYQAYLNGTGSIRYNEIYSQDRLHGFSVGVNAGYEFSRYFGVRGKFNWQPQHGATGILNGFDRPAITVNVSATSKPLDALTLKLDYNLRAKRQLLSGNISRLNFAADYSINERMTVGLTLDNLLNRHEMLLPDLPTEGFTAAGRFRITF